MEERGEQKRPLQQQLVVGKLGCTAGLHPANLVPAVAEFTEAFVHGKG